MWTKIVKGVFNVGVVLATFLALFLAKTLSYDDAEVGFITFVGFEVIVIAIFALAGMQVELCENVAAIRKLLKEKNDTTTNNNNTNTNTTNNNQQQ